MDQEFLKKIGVDQTLPYDKLKEALEEKQLEYLERQQSTTDETRLEELTETLAKIEEASKELFSMASGLAEDDGKTESSNTRKKAEAVKKAETKKQSTQEKQKEKVQETAKVQKETGASAKNPQMSEKTKAELEQIKQADKRKKAEAEEAARKKQEEEEKKKKEQEEAAKKNAYQTALKDLHSGNYAPAFQYFKEESEKGNVEAMYLIGTMYQAGQGTSKDNDRAEFWYREAAKSNHADAMYSLGTLLIKEMNKEEEGLEWLGKASKKDHVQAMRAYINTMETRANLKSKERRNLVMINKKLMAREKDSYQKKQLKKQIQKYSLLSPAVVLRIAHVLLGNGVYGILARVFAIIVGFSYYKYLSLYFTYEGWNQVFGSDMKTFILQFAGFWTISYALVFTSLEADVKHLSISQYIGNFIGNFIVMAIAQGIAFTAFLLVYINYADIVLPWLKDFNQFVLTACICEVLVFCLISVKIWKTLFWSQTGIDQVAKSLSRLFGKTVVVIALFAVVYQFTGIGKTFVYGMYKVDYDTGTLKSVFEYTRGTVRIPEGVRTIGENSLEDCCYVDKVVLPDSITTIEEGAFEGCYALTEIQLPDAVTTIGKNAFSMSGLSEIQLSKNLESIGSGAFKDCAELRSIVIPASVSKIAVNAFINTYDDSVNLESIGYYEENEKYLKKYVKKVKKKYKDTIQLYAVE